MWEMIQNAWIGWHNYTDSGKFAALVVVALLYMWLGVKCKETHKWLMVYGVVSVILCVCPLTAAVLMFYQTRFYNYQWIWSVVPSTALIALAATVFLADRWKGGKSRKEWLHTAVVTLALVAVLVLCGALGQERVDAVEARERRVHSEAVLTEVQNLCGENVCLWAPADLLEDARICNNMRLLYGRNMWDVALNAYSYDVYSPAQVELYEWMEHLDDWAIDITAAEVKEYAQKAFEEGADCILLPDDFIEWMQESETELLDRLKADGNVEVTRLEEYYLLKLR